MRSSQAAVLGRDGELQAVSAFLDDVSAFPAPLVVEGEAGIGKSTVWRQGVAAGRRRGYRVLECCTSDTEVQLSYAALADLFEPALQELSGELRAPQRRALRMAFVLEEAAGAPPDRRAVGVAVLSTLRILASRAPVILAIDDLQWLDAESAAALDFALRRLRDERVGVLVTLRLGTPAPLSSLAEAPRLLLGPLSLGALHRLVHTRLGLSLPRPVLRRVADTTRGNPFFALEIARALACSTSTVAPGDELPLPRTQRALVDERLRSLGPETRHALLVVAALSDARAALVAEAVPEASLDPAFDQGVVVYEGDRIRFSHPLLRSGVYMAAAPAARAEVHRALGGIVADPEQRARHLALASEPPDPAVAKALAAAAVWARARGAPAAAAELWELADHFTLSDRRDERALGEAAECHLAAGDLERAGALLEQVLDASLPGGPRAEALVRLAWVRSHGGNQQAAAQLFDRALTEGRGDPALVAQAEKGVAWMAHMLGDLGSAQEHARAALAASERANDPGLRADALADLGFVDILRGDGGGLTLLRRAVRLEQKLSARWRQILSRPSWLLVLALEYRDELDEARSRLERLQEELIDSGDEAALAFVESHLCRITVLSGDWQRARLHADSCFELSLQGGYESETAFALSNLALVAAHTGDAVAARQYIDDGSRIAERIGLLPVRIELLASLGLLELSLGEPARAEEALSAAAADARAAGFGEPRVFRFHGNAIEALLSLGRLAEVEPLLAELEAATGPWPAAISARCRGLLLAEQGDLGGALALLEDAARLADGLMPFESARSLLTLGIARRRARQKRAAREALRDAAAEFERLGAPAWAARTRAEAARVGGRPPRTQQLTPTEERVAALVAQGLSNKQVAAELYVTVATVETHLTRIYAKVGVRSRAQLAYTLAKPAATS